MHELAGAKSTTKIFGVEPNTDFHMLLGDL
jgi:hypothetical protein